MYNEIIIISAEYGIYNNYLDITNTIKTLFFKDNILFIPKNTNLTKITHDPCVGFTKEIKIYALVCDYPITICEKENNNMLSNNIIINMYSYYSILNNLFKNENSIELNIISVEYGIHNNYFDITNQIKNLFLKDNQLFIPKDTNLNKLVGDHCFGKFKKIKLSVSVNNYPINICETYNNDYTILLNAHYIYYALHPQIEFRLICYSHLSYIRYIDLPNFCEKSNYEAVLVENRCLPHIEFLIRNTIIKLGEKWSHTIICGNLNYEFIKDMCATISKKIKIIKTNYDALLYNNFLNSLDFWNLLNGEKILIYQEDSILFKNNIDDFLHFDYIGSPFSTIENRGLSLRTKSVMKKFINNKIIDNTADYTIGLVADNVSRSLFSSESIVYSNSFGGHKFWTNDCNWKNRIYNNTIIQFNPQYYIYINEITHRGGWKEILFNMNKNNFFNTSSQLYFYDTVEIYFLINNFVATNKWCGIIHWTPSVPTYLSDCDIDIMFNKPNFIDSLSKCVYLISLSKHITKYIEKKLNELNIRINVYTLKHPIDNVEKKFEWKINNYNNNNNKTIIQIGQQLRMVSSIYLLDSLYFNKLWLTGTKNLSNCETRIKNEINYFNIDENKLDKSVKMYYTSTFEEYDDLLSKNVVFIHLIDAGANNTILECIIRNTPIIVNKIAPVVEYLGENYPLYYNNLSEVPFLLTDEKIIEAHSYLCNMNKDDLSFDYFAKQLINITNSNYNIRL